MSVAFPFTVRVWGSPQLLLASSAGMLVVAVLSAWWPANRAAQTRDCRCLAARLGTLMKKSKMILLGLALASARVPARRPRPAPQELLAASDAVRNPDKPFSMVTKLTEFRDGKEVGEMSLAIYAKTEASGGQYRNLVRFIAPARDANKLMLKSGNDLWFFDPSSKASVRMSPQQRLLGQAANGDVVTVNLAKDYSAKLGARKKSRMATASCATATSWRWRPRRRTSPTTGSNCGSTPPTAVR